MRIPFEIKYRDKIESGDYKVETRDGRPARIICWDMISDEPIIALVAGDPNDKTDTSEYILSCFEKGNYYTTKESENDLFIVTPEPEMSEMEISLLSWLSDDTSGEIPMGRMKQVVKARAAELLALSKSQLLQSGELLTQEHHEKLMETLSEECKKDLPRWRKADRDIDAGTIDFAVFHKNDGGDHEDWLSIEVTNRLYKDEYYLELSDLNKLPKEEDHE